MSSVTSTPVSSVKSSTVSSVKSSSECPTQFSRVSFAKSLTVSSSKVPWNFACSFWLPQVLIFEQNRPTKALLFS